jgi:hypothetical protein
MEGLALTDTYDGGDTACGIATALPLHRVELPDGGSVNLCLVRDYIPIPGGVRVTMSYIDDEGRPAVRDVTGAAGSRLLSALHACTIRP